MVVTSHGNDYHSLIAFASIEDVRLGSPADIDELHTGDEIVSFGGIHAGPDSLAQALRLVRESEGNVVEVAVRRQGELLKLSVRPRRWHGEGLLG